MDCITIGRVWDMLAESSNDNVEYPRLATQEDFNEFLTG